jgi:hypothetical protein
MADVTPRSGRYHHSDEPFNSKGSVQMGIEDEPKDTLNEGACTILDEPDYKLPDFY